MLQPTSAGGPEDMAPKCWPSCGRHTPAAVLVPAGCQVELCLKSYAFRSSRACFPPLTHLPTDPPTLQAFVLPSPPASTSTNVPRATTATADTSSCTTTTTAASSRVDFLRSAGGAVVSAAAGLALLPKASSADVFTDDVLGFKFDVSFHPTTQAPVSASLLTTSVILHAAFCR